MVDNRTLTLAEAITINASHKAHEGARLQALFGALGALPAGALVLGSEVAAGAPLFCTALLGIFAAYMFWGYTDAIYHADSLQVLDEATRPSVVRAGYRYQLACFAYGILGVGCTFCGFAAINSTIRSPISVNDGFWTLAALAAIVAAHVIWSSQERNRIIEKTRELSLARATRAKAALEGSKEKA